MKVAIIAAELALKRGLGRDWAFARVKRQGETP